MVILVELILVYSGQYHYFPLLCVPASSVHAPVHVIAISSVNNLPHISVFLYLIMIFHMYTASRVASRHFVLETNQNDRLVI